MTSSLDEVHASLAAYRPGTDAEPLEDALAEVEKVLADPDFDVRDVEDKVYVWMLAGSAAILRTRTRGARPDDLDRAIAWFDLATAATPQDSTQGLRTRANLGTALNDRYERDRDANDLARASATLATAADGLRAAGIRADVALHSLGLTCYNQWQHSRHGEDLVRSIAAYREALACPHADADQCAGYLNSLGLALQAVARTGADPAALAEATDVLRRARTLATRPGPNWAKASFNLARLYLDQFRDRAAVDLLQDAVTLYRDAYEHPVRDGGVDGSALADNLAAALLYQYRLTGDQALLRPVMELYVEVAAAHTTASPAWATAVAGLATLLIEVYDRTGRLTILDRATALYNSLLEHDKLRTAPRCQGMGVCLVKQFIHTGSRAALDRAVGLLAEAAAGMADDIDRAAALSSEANAWSYLFDETGERSPIDTAVQRATAALTAVPASSPESPLYRSNLGVLLLHRFQRFGQSADLVQAVAEQRRANSTPAQAAPRRALILAALADSLAEQARRSGSPVHVDEATATYGEAISTAWTHAPAQALGAAARWGRWAAQRGAWAEAADAYHTSLRVMQELVSSQDDRRHKESWLYATRNLPPAAAVAMLRAGSPQRAVWALDAGRALLLTEAIRKSDQRARPVG